MSTETLTTQKNGSVAEKAYRRRTCAPPVDVYENQDELLIVADVPGAAVESIALKIDKDTLTLSARATYAKEEGRALNLEYAEVDYERSFRIPPGVDAERIAAEAKRGTLLVRLPKTEAAKPRRVVVKAG